MGDTMAVPEPGPLTGLLVCGLFFCTCGARSFQRGEEGTSYTTFRFCGAPRVSPQVSPMSSISAKTTVLCSQPSPCLPGGRTSHLVRDRKTYHVAVTGDDANSGSASSPLKTISAAAQLAQPGDVITVHQGVYRERIDPPRGGESDKQRIVYQAAPGEKVDHHRLRTG